MTGTTWCRPITGVHWNRSHPWIEKDTARHYQFYPFVNLGHANHRRYQVRSILRSTLTSCARGLSSSDRRDRNDVFQVKIPFVWCSNNYVAAALTQCRLYREATGDTRYDHMEAAMRDWLFGCNPWGTSMICGLPAGRRLSALSPLSRHPLPW
ncbi:MAG: glycoside hydrolase family 9 protein [Marinilabiliales bacterium]|nr:glycoside hydrolase family 9 protein [Marinilabiliales bacterium]